MPPLRTPDAHFANLPDFPFPPHYLDDVGDGLRMHYLDEGPADGPVTLLLHGEPTWSYLYRHMVPVLAEAGQRVLAPDMIGFGRSDKPTLQSDHSYAAHLGYLQAFLDQLALTDVTLFCQDWGGLLGLRLVAAQPERFARVCTANTILPTGEQAPNAAFLAWQAFAKTVDDMPVAPLIRSVSVRELSDEALAGYDAPFPDKRYKAGPHVFPSLVPTAYDDPEAAANRAAWAVLSTFERPWLTLFSDSDPILGGLEGVFQRAVPGAAGQPHHVMARAGHFLQEEVGPELARRLVAWCAG